MERENHPVWVVYDLYRTAYLNVKYYKCKRKRAETLNFWMELILAITASSSAIGALTFWTTNPGKQIWQGLGVIAAFVAVMKPLIKLTDKIKQLEEIITGYTILQNDLNKIVQTIDIKRIYDEKIQDDYFSALGRYNDLGVRYIDNDTDTKLIKKYSEEVNKEMPVSRFYVPEN